MLPLPRSNRSPSAEISRSGRPPRRVLRRSPARIAKHSTRVREAMARHQSLILQSRSAPGRASPQRRTATSSPNVTCVRTPSMSRNLATGSRSSAPTGRFEVGLAVAVGRVQVSEEGPICLPRAALGIEQASARRGGDRPDGVGPPDAALGHPLFVERASSFEWNLPDVSQGNARRRLPRQIGDVSRGTPQQTHDLDGLVGRHLQSPLACSVAQQTGESGITLLKVLSGHRGGRAGE